MKPKKVAAKVLVNSILKSNQTILSASNVSETLIKK